MSTLTIEIPDGIDATQAIRRFKNEIFRLELLRGCAEAKKIPIDQLSNI